MFSSKAKLKQRTPENGINREDFIGLLADEYYTTSSAAAKEQVTANLANFAYDPLNYEYLTKHNVIVIFLDLLVSGNEKLIEHGITGICNYCHDPQIHQQLLEDKNLELIRNLLEYQNPRIISPALTTLIYLQTQGVRVDKPVATKRTIERVEELLKEVESEERPLKLKNLLLIFREGFQSSSSSSS